MTALIWILLGELLLLALVAALFGMLAARRRRRKTMDALGTLLDKLKQEEGSRLEALKQHIGHHPSAFGPDSAATAARWLSSEKDFIRALVPIVLTDDIAALARLDEPLRRLLDDRLPAQPVDEVKPSVSSTEESSSTVPADAARDASSPPEDSAVLKLDDEENAGGLAVSAPEADSPSVTAPVEPPEIAPEDEMKGVLPEAAIPAVAQALIEVTDSDAAMPAAESSDDNTVEALEQAFWAGMGFSDTLAASTVDSEAKRDRAESHQETIEPGLAVEELVGAKEDAEPTMPTAELSGDARDTPPALPMQQGQAVSDADRDEAIAGAGGREPTAGQTPIADHTLAVEAAPVEQAESVPEVADAPPAAIMRDETDALDIEVWDELRALAQMSEIEKAPDGLPESAPSAEHQDQPAAGEQAAQE